MSDCPEIQEGHEWEYGDCFIQVYANGEQERLQFLSRELGDLRYDTYPDFEGKKRGIWLPTQSQLQEMVNPESSYPVSHLLVRINEVYGKLEYWGDDVGEITMEQLWLAFYMKEKHDKIWDGDKWELSCPAG